MNLTLSIDDEVFAKARQRVEVLGKSVNQLVCEYLDELAGNRDAAATAAEFVELSKSSRGNSQGWKFNREEIHERR